jgi:hypothetical protein
VVYCLLTEMSCSVQFSYWVMLGFAVFLLVVLRCALFLLYSIVMYCFPNWVVSWCAVFLTGLGRGVLFSY